MARIVTVYSRERSFLPVSMAFVRWLKISESLARLGHEVDIATCEPFIGERQRSWVQMGPNLRRVPLAAVRWDDYDVVKTAFHRGFVTLERYGGTAHPFIISKLGSVIGPTEQDGVYFYGEQRRELFAIQERVQRTSHYVTLLSEAAIEFWVGACGGSRANVLLVPGGVDHEIPAPGRDPYPRDGRIRCVFAGNVYTKERQPEANAVLIEKLNRLGENLAPLGARLYLFGPGDVSRLDPRWVTYLGVVPYELSWDYLRFADVGVVVAAGAGPLHNNESSKIYHYLRVGLPVVSERGFPNENVIRESRLGSLVPPGDMGELARGVVAAARSVWEREHAMSYILRHHTWDRRAEVYDELIQGTQVSRLTRSRMEA